MAELEKYMENIENDGYDEICNLLKYIEKNKIRKPYITLKYGEKLLSNYKYKLGLHVWDIYEQTYLAALEVNNMEIAKICLGALKDKFPNSARVARLQGMELEQRGFFAKAIEIYDSILEKNPSNTLVVKRKVAIAKAQGNIEKAISLLNNLLEHVATDSNSWQELAELYLCIGEYKHSAFCYEELILTNPLNSSNHTRLAEIYATIKGLENLQLARKHLLKSLELNNSNNRARIMLIMCTNAIRSEKSLNNKNYQEIDLNKRVQEKCIEEISSSYLCKITIELANITTNTIKKYAI